MDYEILKPNDVAEIFKVSKRTIWAWNSKGILPAPVKINGRVTGWLRADIEAFIESKKAD